ncbi:ROK family transcriptional regulator [Streptomyces sp. NBC_00243]|uniref:ROK family transcriptional regulator n=1 Tax=Streptomyces sp. NBC_00243 TaxID=2975688 RepID=UPI002DD7A719|nr:ROK family transcriptional regulator [Streptomyces sp. NBC_00243]WRZ22258.1 ROK family transcriptional regulator [Streptomyces sp. NBC_00243]
MAYVNRNDAGSGAGLPGVRGRGRGRGVEVGGAGVNLLALRSHNAALVLDLLRTAGPAGISRLELAERTGLTPQAVSKITARLRADGFAAEAGRRASTGGKPRTVLRLVPDAGHAVGLHLDRDELTAVLCDLTGAVVGERKAPLDLGGGADAVVEDAAREVEALLAGVASVLGVGVALPGPLDHTRGVLHRVTGFPEWDGFPLRDALARRLGVSVVVDKDTNAAALGLAVGSAVGRGLGATGNGSGSFAYLHLGTGLGAGLVIGGAVHRGARTGAGEFGHQVIQLDGPLCGCGDRGCVEVLCLAAVARGAVDEAARVLGVGAANLVGLLDIDLVLLGGRTVAAHQEDFVRGVGAVLDERARREGVAAGVPVRVAPGGERGVAEGAAQLLLGPLFGWGEG